MFKNVFSVVCYANLPSILGALMAIALVLFGDAGAFNPQGTPVAFRARLAIQYGDDIDGVVTHLGTRNNGLYTNEWLIGDAKNNEIAMYELGTHHTRLWRSSKDDWFGGTKGFYWGCNNAKDLTIRLEYRPDPKAPPEYVPFVPAARDLAWQKLYREHRGKIDEQFGFLAFRTAREIPHAVKVQVTRALELWSRIFGMDARGFVRHHFFPLRAPPSA